MVMKTLETITVFLAFKESRKNVRHSVPSDPIHFQAILKQAQTAILLRKV